MDNTSFEMQMAQEIVQQRGKRGRGAQGKGMGGGRGGQTMRGGKGGGSSKGNPGKAGHGGKRGGLNGASDEGDIKSRFTRFIEYVKYNTSETNDTMLISNGLHNGQLGLTDDFQCEELGLIKGKLMFTGRLHIGDLFIARTVDNNKKRVKSLCYSKAVGIFSTYTVEQIMGLTDMGVEAIRQEYVKANEEGRPPKLEVDVKTAGMIPCFDKLKQILQEQLEGTLHIISRVEQTVVAVKAHCRYVEGTSKPEFEKPIFEGSLYLNDIHVGIARKMNKKTTKTSCYEMAVNRFKSISSEVLVKGLSTEEMAEVVTGSVGLLTALQEENLSQAHLQTFIEIMSKPENKPFSANFDIVCLDELKMNPALLFRKPMIKTTAKAEKIMCELYVGRVLISTGQGVSKISAKRAAYENAEVVFSMSTPNSILREHKKLGPDGEKAPDVWQYDIVTSNTRAQSNVHKLKSATWINFPEECVNLKISDIILLDQERWVSERLNQSFGILCFTCNQNGLLLEWDFEKISNNVFECIITIQSENLATVRTAASSKITSKHLAAAHILYQLYETNPIIFTGHTDTNPIPLTLEDVKAEAERLKASGVLVEELKIKEKAPKAIQERKPGTSEKSMKTEEASSELSKPPPTPKARPEKYVVHAFKVLINKIFLGGNLQEVQLEAGFPYDLIYHSEFMNDKNFHLRRSSSSETMTCYRTYHPKKMLEILKRNNGASGKYRILSPSEVPKHSDLQLELASSQRILNAAIKQQEESEKTKQMAKTHVKAAGGPGALKRKMPPPVQNSSPGFNKKSKNQGHGFKNFNQGFQAQKQKYAWNPFNGGQKPGFKNYYQGFQKQNFYNPFNQGQGFQRNNFYRVNQGQGFQQGFQKKNFNNNFHGFQNQRNTMMGGFQKPNFNRYANQQNQQFTDSSGGFWCKEQDQSMEYNEEADLYLDFTSDIPHQHQGFQKQNLGFHKQNFHQKSHGIRPPKQMQHFNETYQDYNQVKDFGQSFQEYEHTPVDQSAQRKSSAGWKGDGRRHDFTTTGFQQYPSENDYN